MTFRIYRPRGIFWVARFNLAIYYGEKRGFKITLGLLGYGFAWYTKGCATVPDGGALGYGFAWYTVRRSK